MPKRSGPVRRALVEQRRSQILTAALAVFARKGYDRATIADIAREAGVADGSIYNYFKNKSDLLISLPRQIVQPNVETIVALLSPPPGTPIPPPSLVLPRIAHAMVETFRQNAPLFRILLSALPAMKPAARQKYLEQFVLYVLGIIESYLRNCVEQGLMRADLNPYIAARGFVGLFFPFILLEDVLQIPVAALYDQETMIDQMVSVFLEGTLAHGQPARSARRVIVE